MDTPTTPPIESGFDEPATPAPAEGSAVEWVRTFLDTDMPPTERDAYNANYEALRPLIKRYVRKLEELAQRCDAAERELEREQCRLAACGVVALSDTPESALEARKMHPDYESASCNDVARRVDECIALRAQLAAAQSEATALRVSWKNAEERLTEEISHSKEY